MVSVCCKKSSPAWLLLFLTLVAELELNTLKCRSRN